MLKFQNPMSSNHCSIVWQVRTELDARALIRTQLSNMSYADLIDVLGKISTGDDKNWLMTLIFEEMNWLNEPMIH